MIPNPKPWGRGAGWSCDVRHKKEADKTWEAWIRFELSNSIYDELEEAPHSVTGMEGKQLQGLKNVKL